MGAGGFERGILHGTASLPLRHIPFSPLQHISANFFSLITNRFSGKGEVHIMHRKEVSENV
jgi:hypothetical protein